MNAVYPGSSAEVDMTVGGLYNFWMENYACVHTRSSKEFARDFRLYLSEWRERRLSDVRRRDIIELQSALFRAKGASAANRTVCLLSMMFNKAVEWELMPSNPAAKIRKFRIHPRERFLLPDELPRFLRAVSSLRNPTTRDYFLMLLWTGQRRRNVAEMEWNQIDLAQCVWHIPRTKTGDSLTVPLVNEAVMILRQRSIWRHPRWVFPKADGSGPIWCRFTAWQRVLERAGITNLRLHDLRRSHASYQAINGENLPIIARTLGHRDIKSTMIYARLNLEPVRLAMERAVSAMLATEAQPR